MSESERDPTLPEGCKELLDVLVFEKRTDIALKAAEKDIAAQGQKLAPMLFARLRRNIDHDLLFCNEPDLIMPEINAMTAKVIREMSPGMPPGHLDSWIVEIISREVFDYIKSHRPKSDPL